MTISLLCSVEGCGKDAKTTGLCNPHYRVRHRKLGPQRWKRPETVAWRMCAVCPRPLAEHRREEVLFGCRT